MGRLARFTVGGCLLVVLASACAHTPERGVRHPVKPGETIYRIGKFYGVPVRSILRANRIRDPRSLRAGARLWIPGARRQPPGFALRPPEANGEAPRRAARAHAARHNGLAFAWPVRGRLTSRYGWRWGRRHEGIDVAARRGTPIRAAEDGRVIYSGNGLGAYGKTVILRHSGRYDTVYAHNHRNRVRKGERVRKGDVIAEVGATGNATGPHLHFEIRLRDEAHDPLLFLP